jgi:hypothetical protein
MTASDGSHFFLYLCNLYDDVVCADLLARSRPSPKPLQFAVNSKLHFNYVYISHSIGVS